jgi:ribosomal-protein-alanine N-acetyltransferase
LESERVVARDIERDDLARLQRYDERNRERFRRFAPERTVGDEARSAQLDERLRQCGVGIVRQFIVFAKPSSTLGLDADEMLGLVTLDSISGPPDASATISYSVDGAYEGRGYAAECVRLVAGFAFERLALERLDATVYLGNARSRRLLERCGFELVAELREVPPGLEGLLSPHAAFMLRRRATHDEHGSNGDTVR